MSDDDINPYLQTETLQQWVKANLRAWSTRMAEKRAAEAEAEVEAASAVPAPEPEPAEVEDEDAALFRAGIERAGWLWCSGGSMIVVVRS